MQFAKHLNFTIRNCLQLNWTERQKTPVDYLSKHLEQSGEDWWPFNAGHIFYYNFFHAYILSTWKNTLKNSTVHTLRKEPQKPKTSQFFTEHCLLHYAMNFSLFKKHFGQAADETAQSSGLCTSKPYRQGNPKQSSPRSPCQSTSLPFHTHCSSFWNPETIQLCVTKAGRWSLQPGTQPEGRHSIWQNSLCTADGAHWGKNPHGASPSWLEQAHGFGSRWWKGWPWPSAATTNKFITTTVQMAVQPGSKSGVGQPGRRPPCWCCMPELVWVLPPSCPWCLPFCFPHLWLSICGKNSHWSLVLPEGSNHAVVLMKMDVACLHLLGTLRIQLLGPPRPIPAYCWTHAGPLLFQILPKLDWREVVVKEQVMPSFQKSVGEVAVKQVMPSFQKPVGEVVVKEQVMPSFQKSVCHLHNNMMPQPMRHQGQDTSQVDVKLQHVAGPGVCCTPHLDARRVWLSCKKTHTHNDL